MPKLHPFFAVGIGAVALKLLVKGGIRAAFRWDQIKANWGPGTPDTSMFDQDRFIVIRTEAEYEDAIASIGALSEAADSISTITFWGSTRATTQDIWRGIADRGWTQGIYGIAAFGDEYSGSYGTNEPAEDPIDQLFIDVWGTEAQWREMEDDVFVSIDVASSSPDFPLVLDSAYVFKTREGQQKWEPILLRRMREGIENLEAAAGGDVAHVVDIRIGATHLGARDFDDVIEGTLDAVTPVALRTTNRPDPQLRQAKLALMSRALRATK